MLFNVLIYKQMRLYSLIFSGFFALVFFSSCSDEEKQAKPKKVPLVQVDSAAIIKMVDYIDIIGSIKPNVVTDIKSSANGVVETLNARENQRVEKNQVIAVVDPADRVSLISNNRMIVERIAKQLETLEVNSKAYETVSKELEKAKNDLAFAQNMYNTIPIICPMNGLVTKRWVEQGSQISASDKIVTISDMNSLVIKAEVNEKYFNAVKKGNKLSVVLNAYPHDTLTGVINLIYPEIDPTTRSVKFDIKILHFQERLLPGMMASIKIPVVNKENALAVLDDAILSDPLSNYFVFVVNQDDLALKRIVEMGISEGNKTEILTGISEGEMIVVEGQEMLKDSVKVKIVK
jgi:RND family efflux transporter MFP subunit